MTITDWKYWKSKWDDERLHSKSLEAMVRRAKEERDAIQAKTIEECVVIIKDYYADAASTEIISDLIAAIRALAQPFDSSTSTQKTSGDEGKP